MVLEKCILLQKQYLRVVLEKRHSYYSIDNLQTIASTLVARSGNVNGFMFSSIVGMLFKKKKVNENSLIELKIVFFLYQVKHFNI